MFEGRCDLDIQRLRRETEAEYRAVEGSLPLMRQGLDTAQYVRCLRRMFGIVAAWEEHAAEIAPEWMRPTLAARQRKHLLERDLAWFGATKQDDRRPELPDMKDVPSLLGTMYVIEGSTLGGQLIARHLEATLHLIEGRGDSYFRGHGAQTGPMWKEFCKMMKIHVPDDQIHVVVASARAMFIAFREWMQGNPAMDGS